MAVKYTAEPGIGEQQLYGSPVPYPLQGAGRTQTQLLGEWEVSQLRQTLSAHG